MKSLIVTGHVAGCTDRATCRCALVRYLIVGFGAAAAALFLIIVSADASLAIYTDIPHIVGDSISYFLSAAIVFAFGRLPDDSRIKRAGNKAVSLLLALSAVFVVVEAYERLQMTEYPFNSLRSAFGGTVACIINLGCWFILKADKNPDLTDDGLVLHAESDAAHAGTVALATLLVPAAVSLGSYVGIPAKPIHFDFTISAVLFLYMMLLSASIWGNKGCGHSHRRHPAVRLILRLRGKQDGAGEHHHHHGEECSGHDHKH